MCVRELSDRLESCDIRHVTRVGQKKSEGNRTQDLPRSGRMILALSYWETRGQLGHSLDSKFDIVMV